MDTQLFLVLGIAIVVIVAVVVMDLYGKQKRIKQMRAVAERLGYEYTEKAAGSVDVPDAFPLFSQGRSGTRKATNVLRTQMDGTAITFFDYAYTVGRDKNQRTTNQSVLLLHSERLGVPAFAMRPEGFGAKLLGVMGQKDIDFEDHPSFSKTYLLQGADESQIRALFSAEKLAYFSQRPGLCVEGNGQGLLYYQSGKRVSPDSIPSFIEEGMSALQSLAGN